MLSGGFCDGSRRHLHRLWLAGSQCRTGQRRIGRWRWSVVFGSKFFLVAHCRHRGRVRGIGVWIYEYGWSTWWSRNRLPYALDRSALRLDRFFPCSRGFMSGGRIQLARSESSEHAYPGAQRQSSHRATELVAGGPNACRIIEEGPKWHPSAKAETE